MKSKGNSYNCGSTLQLWYAKAEAQIAASAIAGSAVLKPAIAVTDVVIPHSLHPSLIYSYFIYPHSQNLWFTQLLCLWASFQGRTQRLSRLIFETCSRLLARMPAVPTLSVEKKPTGKAWRWHGQTNTPFPSTLRRRLAMQWALVDGHALKSQVQGAAEVIAGTWCQCQPIALILCPALFVACR